MTRNRRTGNAQPALSMLIRVVEDEKGEPISLGLDGEWAAVGFVESALDTKGMMMAGEQVVKSYFLLTSSSW